MFGFLSMLGNYESRKVDRYEEDGLIVDTAEVTDSSQPYETAVSHPKYNDGKWVIVQMHETLEAAKTGHKEWVKKMTAKTLPSQIKDVSTCDIAKLIDNIASDEKWRKFNAKASKAKKSKISKKSAKKVSKKKKLKH